MSNSFLSSLYLNRGYCFPNDREKARKKERKKRTQQHFDFTVSVLCLKNVHIESYSKSFHVSLERFELEQKLLHEFAWAHVAAIEQKLALSIAFG